MKSMPAAVQAAVIRTQPSTESWSVNASAANPSRWPCPTSSSGENVPSEKYVCKCKSANFIRFSSKLLLDDSRRAQEFPFDFGQNAVDEFAAVLGGEFLRNVHRFVNADDGWDVLAMEHFIDGQSHDVAVHSGNAVEFPVLRMRLDALVDRVAVLEYATDQRIGKQAGLS